MDKPKKSFDKSILYLKGVCIVFVLMHHLTNKRLSEEEILFLKDIVVWINWAVYAFFFASGYLFAISYQKKSIKVLDQMKKRSQRLLIPYFLYAFLFLFVMELMSSFIPNAREATESSMLDKLLGVLSVDASAMIGGQLYFLPMLLIIELSFLLFLKVFKNSLFPQLLLILGAVIILFFFENQMGDEFRRTGFFIEVYTGGLLMYSLGFLFQIRNFFSKNIVLLSSSLFFIGLSFVIEYSLDLLSGFYILAPILFVHFLKVVNFEWLNFALEPLGKYSGYIFVLHNPFILQTLIILLIALKFDFAVLMVISVLVSVVLPIIIGFICNKYKFLSVFRV